MNVNGFEWPEKDQHCREVIFQSLNHLDQVIDKYVKGRRVVVQAGGNCGVWPKHLSKKFETVYTFEPDAENFRCLVFNVSEPNVVKMQCALGRDLSLVKTHLDEHELDNIGAYRVVPGGIVPTLSLDSLGLRNVDLLYLDIEGYELQALQGAYRLLLESKPCVALELKNLSSRYGYTDEDVVKYLTWLGYKQVDRIANDSVFVHG